jgi:hypothetical protein
MADRTPRTPNASLAPVIGALVPERFVLEQAQVVLLARLHNRPDDFAATTELQAMNALSARLKSQIPPRERDRLVRQGLSSVDRTRMWLRSKVHSRGRGAQTIVAAAGPCPEAPTTTAVGRGVVGGASPAPPRHLATAPMVSKTIRRGGHLHAGRGGGHLHARRGAAMTTRRVQ